MTAAVMAAAGAVCAVIGRRTGPGAGNRGTLPHAEAYERIRPVMPAGSRVKLIVAADIHYISPRLNDGGELFLRTVGNGDGKLTDLSPEVADAFLELTAAGRPDALVICGDLTFNGAKASLEDMCGKLKALTEKGIPVLVIPGNHDINYPIAYAFSGAEAARVENIREGTFRAMCAGFGYGEAASRDPASFSYIYPVSEDLSLLFLDANTEKAPGELLPETLKWAERVLKDAGRRGVRVISVTHQNVVPQNKVFQDGFVVKNREKTTGLLRKYGVRMNLSGHAHLMHSAEEAGLLDHCTGCLTLSPLMFAEVLYEPSVRAGGDPGGGAGPGGDPALSYTPRHLSVFQEEAKRRYEETAYQQVLSALSGVRADEKTRGNMADFAVRFNEAYFNGTLDMEAMKKDPGWQLWERYGSSSFYFAYMKTAGQ